MNEREAKEATRLRDEAYAALKGGAMERARDVIEAFMPYDRVEGLELLTSLGIETNDAGTAEKALGELEELAPEKPNTRYLSARVAYMKGARAALLEPLESILEDKNTGAQVRKRVCSLLGRCCRLLGEAGKAAKFDLEASRIAPELGANEYSNYLYDLHYLPGISPEEQREAAARYNDYFKDVKRFSHRRRHGARPLRIGYISADFRYHVLLRFVAAMLLGHVKTPFTVYAYMTGEEDEFSLDLSKNVDYWRNLRNLSPEEAANRIYEDGIDILVELGGHTVGNSLSIMAYKPAPIQISGIGYWASTGLSAIDYFLGDVYLDDEETQKAFTEKLLVLPHTHFCYTEVVASPCPAEAPPCRRNGSVTFGSFTDFGKMSDETLRLWAEILERVPGSRLLLKGKIFDEPDNRAYALARMERMGIPQERVEARGFSRDYLREYADMDVALDTFPYPGGGTTCDALFMGVPVVTMAGADHGGRFGKSLLMNLGLGELVANTAEEYVEKAVGLAGDEELLLVLRQKLRDMMRRSPLMNMEQYRKDLTAAYIRIWKKFLREQSVPEAEQSDDGAGSSRKPDFFDVSSENGSHYTHDPAAEHHDVLRVGYILHGTEEKDKLSLTAAFFGYIDQYRFEVYGYSLGKTVYKNTTIVNYATAWRELFGLSAREAAECIYADGIDILVDLTAGDADNALPILAYKPAPIQVSAVQSRMTTGASAVDYFLTDVYAAPKGEEKFFSEKLLRLPESQICCMCPQGARLYSLPAPVLEAGHLTFGVLARWEKATDDAIRAWAGILRCVDGARLLVQDGTFSDKARRAEAMERLEAAGLDESRVELVAWTESYLADYERVDIALDTYPRTGRRSVCEALYMGIPVVARKGRVYAERSSESILMNIGMDSFCVPDWPSYIQAAVRLAKDRAKLVELHLTLRRKIEHSAVMNAQRYMDALEEAYGNIFVAWERSADEETQRDSLKCRWARFQRARTEKRWKEAAAIGSRLVFAGVNLPDSAVHVAQAYYVLKDDRHLLYWMRRAERLKPPGRARLLGWLAYSQEKRLLLLSAAKTYQQMLYSIGSSQDDKLLRQQGWMRYGRLMFILGEVEKSLHAYTEAYRFGDTTFRRAIAYGGFLLSHNNDDVPSQDLFNQSRRYSKLFKGIKRYSHSRQRPEHSRLRIGYVSPDFGGHVMSHFIVPFLMFRDKTRFEVYAYNSAAEKVPESAVVKQLADVWRDIDRTRPEVAAKAIYEDEIDILFDLSGHTANSAIAAFAYKPAPVQISGLGYMATTGLDTMDYFLTDPFVDPMGEGRESYFVEKPLYVTTQFCYAAIGKHTYPASEGTPSKQRGWVLFGVFNQYAKVKDEMLLAWKEILCRVPRSRILLKSHVLESPEVAEAAYQRLKALGLPMERVIFEPATKNYMERYLDVDIALDTYPWPGGGTTCDTLYMGVPVVSLYGERRSTRFSYGLLQNIGLGELTAATVEEYIEKAVALAQDEELLDALHKNLRKMMERSPLMDATRYIREVEARYEEIWKKWREGRS